MAVKTYKVRIDIGALEAEAPCDAGRFRNRAEEVLQYLWDTHVAFNRGVAYLASELLRMRRGAGVWRECAEAVWQNWRPVQSFDELQQIRARRNADGKHMGLVENTQLLSRFTGAGRTEAESVTLALCCADIFKTICPPSEEDEQIQMPRSVLNLLTKADSDAKGVRPARPTRSGKEKKRTGRCPRWLLDKATAEVAADSSSLDEFIGRLKAREEFRSAQKDGAARLDKLARAFQHLPWAEAKATILRRTEKWPEEKIKADQKKADETTLYRPLLEAGCLPIPGFDRPENRLGIEGCKAEWSLAMWNMAGQKVRSHLGWVNRRLEEKSGHQAEDAAFSAAYSGRRWYRALKQYEEEEMPKQLAGVAVAAKEVLRIRARTLKGWERVVKKWRDLLKKDADASADELIEVVNRLRKRRSQEVGGHHILEWLARSEQRFLWDGSHQGEGNDCGRADRDCVTAYVARNEKLARPLSSITFTENHPVKHPTWAFFGENSAVKYRFQRAADRLYVIFDQLMCSKADGTGYATVDKVRVPLRGYSDFQASFLLPDGDQVASTAPLEFVDDLLAGRKCEASLGGMKLPWDRQSFPPTLNGIPQAPPTNRVYVSFSCDVTALEPPAALRKGGQIAAPSGDAQDGVKGLLNLRRTITRVSTAENAPYAEPGNRQWPPVATQMPLRILSVDLGQRHGAAMARWELSSTLQGDAVSWKVGHQSEGTEIWARLLDRASISLPGDDEPLPLPEEELRQRLRKLRARLNLQNSLLRAARLLSLESFEKRSFGDKKERRRSNGVCSPCGRRSFVRAETLSSEDIRNNCVKAATQLLRWSQTDAMRESLTAAGHPEDFWAYLGTARPELHAIAALVPKTEVPEEEETAQNATRRSSLTAQRDAEEQAFHNAVFERRLALAGFLCNGHDARNRRRATSGLWAELDAALLREVSYSNRPTRNDQRESLRDKGLLPLLRRPPAVKHRAISDHHHLPIGRTLRGGLAMHRLNFLEEVRSFVRKWSCRPRWPGDVRRLSRDMVFGVQDARHLDHLREHRVKLLAHCIAAAALGFEQDVRRGLWRYRHQGTGELFWQHPETRRFFREDTAGRLQQVGTPDGLDDAGESRPHPVRPPAHIIVLENLARYNFKQDRPRNENAGLMLWSHRQLLKFIKHIGGLFGIQLAVAYAAYSSRFCSLCGAPGFRASRFDPKWLNQEWMRRIRASKEIQDQPMRKAASEVEARLAENPTVYDRAENRPWVIREGGTHFACANPQCPSHLNPIDADENAAANIGLRFLRGMEDFRTWITLEGRCLKPLRYAPDLSFVKSSPEDGGDFWTLSVQQQPPRRRAQRRNTEGEESAETDGEHIDSGNVVCLLRDPSGNAIRADRWCEQDVFWNVVRRRVAAGIKAANAEGFVPEEK